VLLPTPPLPEATAIVLRTPGSTAPDGVVAAAARPRVFAVIVTATDVTPGRAATRSRAAFSNSAFTGQAGVVSSIVNETLPPSIARFFTNPRSTMLLPKSGSTMGRSASSTLTSVRGAGMTLLETRKEREVSPRPSRWHRLARGPDGGLPSRSSREVGRRARGLG
jgi:hypothetical protein